MMNDESEAHSSSLFAIRGWRIVPAGNVSPLSVEAARDIDRAATERYGIPTLLLMERAALGLEVVALEMLAQRGSSAGRGDRSTGGAAALTSEQVSGTVVILCGPGSNGGDGFALGRLLLNRGIRARICALPGAGASGDSAINRGIFERMGGDVADAVPDGSAPALIVDALFGTGLSRAVEGAGADLIGWANRARAGGSTILAVDIPSGIDATTGQALGPAVEADTTVTFVGPKPGLLTPAGRARAGRIVVAPIGAPGEQGQESGVRSQESGVRSQESGERARRPDA